MLNHSEADYFDDYYFIVNETAKNNNGTDDRPTDPTGGS